MMEKKIYNEFQSEMARLRAITYRGYEKTLKEIGIAYLAEPNSSSKLMHNERLNMLTYGLYLASSDLCGINVCPRSSMCRESCLVGSGRSRVDAQSHKGIVERARILKTRLFFANKPLFMKLMCIEINRAINKAKRLNMGFSVRLNCTSDISPLAFSVDGKSILDIYPNVNFYDYTKVKKYWDIMDKHSNYYVTFSRDGSEENEKECLEFLKRGGNVAVVFGVNKSSELPKRWKGYNVLVGDDYDYRLWDKLQSDKQIVGLVYKKSKNDYEEINGRFRFKGIPKSPFIIDVNNEDCEF